MVGRWRALPISLSGIGISPGLSSIIFAAPVVTLDLLALQTDLVDGTGLPVHPHYRPGTWVPHVTLMGLVLDPGRVVTALLRH